MDTGEETINKRRWFLSDYRQGLFGAASTTRGASDSAASGKLMVTFLGAGRVIWAVYVHAAATAPGGGGGEHGGVCRKLCGKGAQRGLGAAKAVYERMGGEEERSRDVKHFVRGEHRWGGA